MNIKTQKAALVAVIAVIAGYGMYANQAKEKLSDVMLENIEALAINEEIGGGGVDCCNNRDECKGAYCGIFYPADNGGSGNGIKLYYKL